MTKLCARGKAAAKRKFDVYPSAYANAYASKICAGKIKDPSGKKKKDWGPKKAKMGTMVRTLAKKVFGKKESQAEPKSSSFMGSGSPLINLYQKKVKPVKASQGQFAEKLQPYDGSYIKGNLAGHEVANPSLNNYYKDLL